MMMSSIGKIIVREYSVLLYATLAFLILACNITVKAADKSINSQPKQVNQAKKVEPWSNEALKDIFYVKKKEYASFSVKINEKMPEYNFKIVGKRTKVKNLKGIYFIPQYVEVNLKGKTIQKLKARGYFDNNGEGWDEFDFSNIVEFVDMNFDGYLDLRLLYSTGATGNNWYATYLFNPNTGKFVYHKELSELCGITIDKKSKQIITYNRGGSCAEYREYYKWVRNKLVLLKAKWTEMDRNRDEEVNGFGCFMYTGIPRHANVKIDPDRMINYDGSGASYIRKRMKNIKEKPLYGSLDDIK